MSPREVSTLKIGSGQILVVQELTSEVGPSKFSTRQIDMDKVGFPKVLPRAIFGFYRRHSLLCFATAARSPSQSR